MAETFAPKHLQHKKNSGRGEGHAARVELGVLPLKALAKPIYANLLGPNLPASVPTSILPGQVKTQHLA